MLINLIILSNSKYINFNGSVCPREDAVLPASDPAVKYGDGLFETMRMINGVMPLMDEHYDRLVRGMKVLKINIPEHYSTGYFKEQVSALSDADNIGGNARIRLAVFRKEVSDDREDNNAPFFTIEISSIPDETFDLNKKGLSIDVYEDNAKPISILSNYKTNNYLVSVLAGIYAKEKWLDDCLLMNDKGNIIEARSSNIFIVNKKELLTPPVSDGCVDGIMRKQIIAIATQQKIKVKEESLSISQLLDADEIFLTNAIYGIRWVKQFRFETYANNTAPILAEHLNNLIFALTKNEVHAKS